MKLGRKNPVLCQAGLTVQPRTLAVLCTTVDRCMHNVVKRSGVKIFSGFFQQAEFYIFSLWNQQQIVVAVWRLSSTQAFID
ncbi:20S-pre-rRNA D-site endonuclease nob1 [Trichinella pseudospiralis]